MQVAVHQDENDKDRNSEKDIIQGVGYFEVGQIMAQSRRESSKY
jgi:hypothetical protein